MSSLFLLFGAAALVAILHSILPDHWVPLAIIGRTQRWGLWRVARISGLAALGHIITSLILGGILALIGLQFQHQFETQQGHIVGAVLVITGIAFLVWGLLGGGHDHHEHVHDHDEHHDHDHEHAHHDEESVASKTGGREASLARRLAAIAVPFGVAASPDLTILPVALAASALGGGAITGVLLIFALITLITFVGLTLIGTLAGYQIKGEWLEDHSTTITALVLIAIGIVAYIGL